MSIRKIVEGLENKEEVGIIGKGIDFSLNQPLMSIRQGNENIGYIEAEDGKIVTSGFIGENEYDNFVELIYGLQGFNIKIDDFFF